MTKGNPNLPEHLPYEEEARMLSDVIEFFIHRLPHAIGATVDHIDEAALSTELMHRLEVMSDDDLKGMGLHRERHFRAFRRRSRACSRSPTRPPSNRP